MTDKIEKFYTTDNFKIYNPDTTKFDERLKEIAEKLGVEEGSSGEFDYFVNKYSLTKLILAFLNKLDEKI